eukprot:Skav235080  [mRNA]  locus=scaffold2106:55022:57632:- [translate_table: standard]
MMVEPGTIIECYLPPDYAMKDFVMASFLVVHKEIEDDGSLSLTAKSLGSSDPEVTKKLSGAFNRKEGIIHVCTSEDFCTFITKPVFHLRRLAIRDPRTFNPPYLQAAGRRLLKGGTGADEGKAPPPEKRVEEEKATPKNKASKRKKPEGGTGKGTGGGTRKAPGPKEASGSEAKDYAALRKRLEELRDKTASKRKPPVEDLDGEELDSGDQKAIDQAYAAVPRLGTGRTVPLMSQELQAMVKPGTGLPGPKKVRAQEDSALAQMKNAGGSLAEQLALSAAVAVGIERRGEKKGNKKTKKTRKKKKRKSKRSAKKKKKRASSGGGSPGDSGSPYPSSASEGDPGSDGDESSSSSRKYLPPLKKKSDGSPGSVLRLLLKTIEDQMSMVGEVTGHEGSTLGGGKVMTYLNSLVRQQGVNATSRDGREHFPDRHMHRSAEDRTADVARRCPGLEVFSFTPSFVGRQLERSEEPRDPYARDVECSRASGDDSSSTTHENARQSEAKCCIIGIKKCSAGCSQWTSRSCSQMDARSSVSS